MTATPGLRLPRFYEYYNSTVKMVETADGGMAAWQLSIDTGGWKPANHIIDEILFAREQEIYVRSRQEFVQKTELWRGHYLRGEGPIFALYETVNGLIEPSIRELRPLTTEEDQLVRSIRRKTFRMFEEKLQREGDPAADPSLAD